MNIFLTGGTGFIGSHFINEALSKNHIIKAIKRGKNSYPKIPLKINPSWIIKKFDELTTEDLQESEILIHLAAHSTNFPYDNLANCLKYNVLETLKLFDLAYEAGIRRFIITGSSFEYGRKGSEYEYIPPDAALFPTQTYPTSKAAASIIMTQWAIEKKVSFKILRLFQIYGEGELNNRLWPTLKQKALSGENLKMTYGEQIRDFIKVEEIVKSILKESSNLEKEKIIIKNLGSGNPKKLKEFVYECWEKLNAKGELEFGEIPYRENEVMRYVPDIEREYLI